MTNLFDHLEQTTRYLNDQVQATFNPADLIVWINEARLQIALGCECIHATVQFALVAGQQLYSFSGATFPSSPAGVGGVGSVRGARIVLPSGGQKRLEVRAWEWFSTYYLSRSLPQTGMPTIMARQSPGIGGSFAVAPVPDEAYTLNSDVNAYPAALALDTDPEALPQPWTDAVPFFAAHLAMLSIGQIQPAEMMWAEYQTFELRAIQMTTPSRLSRSYSGGMGARMAGAVSPLTAARAAGAGR